MDVLKDLRSQSAVAKKPPRWTLLLGCMSTVSRPLLSRLSFWICVYSVYQQIKSYLELPNSAKHVAAFCFCVRKSFTKPFRLFPCPCYSLVINLMFLAGVLSLVGIIISLIACLVQDGYDAMEARRIAERAVDEAERRLAAQRIVSRKPSDAEKTQQKEQVELSDKEAKLFEKAYQLAESVRVSLELYSSNELLPFASCTLHSFDCMLVLSASFEKFKISTSHFFGSRGLVLVFSRISSSSSHSQSVSF